MMRWFRWLPVLGLCFVAFGCSDDTRSRDVGTDTGVRGDAGPDACSGDACGDASAERCDETGECSEAGEVCGELRDDGDETRAYCTPADEEAPFELGEQCESFDDCRERICLQEQSDECSVVCVDDSQCASGQVCSTLDVGASALGFCISTCQVHDDCTGLDFEEDGESVEHVCSVNFDEGADQYDQVCVRRETVDENDPEAGRLGDRCPGGDNDACQAGLCLKTAIFDGSSCSADDDCDGELVCEETDDGQKECADFEHRCSRLCEDDDDCAGGVDGNELTACDSEVTIDDSQTVSMCTMPR